ncbi:hypothetical protein BRADI_4g33025v3, partial [Brachypodium distachyon]
ISPPKFERNCQPHARLVARPSYRVAKADTTLAKSARAPIRWLDATTLAPPLASSSAPGPGASADAAGPSLMAVAADASVAGWLLSEEGVTLAMGASPAMGASGGKVSASPEPPASGEAASGPSASEAEGAVALDSASASASAPGAPAGPSSTASSPGEEAPISMTKALCPGPASGAPAAASGPMAAASPYSGASTRPPAPCSGEPAAGPMACPPCFRARPAPGAMAGAPAWTLPLAPSVPLISPRVPAAPASSVPITPCAAPDAFDRTADGKDFAGEAAGVSAVALAGEAPAASCTATKRRRHPARAGAMPAMARAGSAVRAGKLASERVVLDMDVQR